tara:strand:- start:1734 stop:1910 length:177 start_codon:yes stop_codon:yes gene_type:complete
MRIVRIGNKIRITYTNQEVENINEYGNLEVSLGLLKIMFIDIANIIQEMLPSLKKDKK